MKEVEKHFLKFIEKEMEKEFETMILGKFPSREVNLSSSFPVAEFDENQKDLLGDMQKIRMEFISNFGPFQKIELKIPKIMKIETPKSDPLERIRTNILYGQHRICIPEFRGVVMGDPIFGEWKDIMNHIQSFGRQTRVKQGFTATIFRNDLRKNTLTLKQFLRRNK